MLVELKLVNLVPSIVNDARTKFVRGGRGGTVLDEFEVPLLNSCSSN
jgi:hypothetical protein